MKYILQLDSSFTEDIVILRGNTRNREYLQNAILLLQKSTYQLKLFDDEHNMFLISYLNIYYIENIDNKVYAYTKSQVYRSYKRFSEMKSLLHEFDFRQINKSTLVNIIHIQFLHIAKDCHRILTLDNQEQLVVNRHFRSSLDI